MLEKEASLIVALNLWDEAKHTGIEIDVAKLEKLLDVPIVPTVALTGEGIKELVSRLRDARSPKGKRISEEERWTRIGSIIRKVEKVKHRHHALRERISDISIRGYRYPDRCFRDFRSLLDS